MRISTSPIILITLMLLASCGRSTETVVIRSDPAAMAEPSPERIQVLQENETTDRFHFRYGEWQKIASLDPLFADNNASLRAVQLIFEGLVRFDEQGNIIPAHAGRWQTDNDSLAWTFSLNRNRFFHNDESFITGQGRRVTAGDFKRSFERMASPDVPTHAADLFREVIYGFDAYYLEQRNLNPGKTVNYTQVEGIIAQNDSTLRIELNRKDPQFLQRLASPYAVVYPMEAVRHHGALHRSPVGSGPFSLSSVTGDSLFVLNRYNGYPGSTANGINRIEIHSIGDETRVLRAFASGRIDLIPDLGPLLLQHFVDENGEPESGSNDLYRLTSHGTKTYEIAYNPSNRFAITREQAGSLLQNAMDNALLDTLRIPMLEIGSDLADSGSDGFETIRQRFPESVSRRNQLLINYPGYESGYLVNAIADNLRNRNVNIRTINTRASGIDLLLFTRQADMNPDGTVTFPDAHTLISISIPRFSATLKNISGVEFNNYGWWMNINRLSRTASQS